MGGDDNKHEREDYLGYEELDADERREVDEYLARNPSARARLEELRALERRAVEPMGAINPDESGAADLDAADRVAERRSREELLTRLGIATDAAPPRAPRRGTAPRRARSLWWPAAAAAAVLLFLLGPWNGARGPQLEELRVVKLEDGRQTRSVADGLVMRSGDVFALEFALSRDAYLVVYYVDPGGQVDLVLPETAGEPAPHVPAGVVRIPGADDPDQWVLGGDPGREGFVIATSKEPLPVLAELDAALREELPLEADRADRLRFVRAFLESRMDAVIATEFDHQP